MLQIFIPQYAGQILKLTWIYEEEGLIEFNR
jgi:hypothetical protein